MKIQICIFIPSQSELLCGTVKHEATAIADSGAFITKARIYDKRAMPPFPHNGIKVMPAQDLLKLLTKLESMGVNWRDAARRVASADVEVKEFIEFKAGSSLAALAAAEPINAAFEVHPRAFTDTAGSLPEPGNVPGVCLD
jgi:hypothetical protein